MIVNKEQIDFTDKFGNSRKKLIVSYVASDGKIKFMEYEIPLTQMYKWQYAKRKCDINPNYISYDHKAVKKVPCKRLSEHRMNELLADLCRQNPKLEEMFDYNVPDTYFCDIETDVDDSGFSYPEVARNPVNTISIAHFPDSIVWVRKPLGEGGLEYITDKFRTYKSDSDDTAVIKDYHFTYRYFDNEADMLMDFFKYIKDVPALTGWNFTGYDMNYMYNRATKVLGMDISFLSPTRHFFNFKISNTFFSVTCMLPYHKIVYDYMMVYKKWDKSVEIKENNTLDFVAEAVLGYKKVEHSLGFKEFYEQQYADYVFYNAVDSILVEQIDKKIHTSRIWFNMASELRIEMNMAFSTIAPTEIVLGNFAYQKNMVIPEVYKEPVNEKGYKGAFVWKTQPGIYKYVGSLDFQSLYPTCIRQFNMSPETYVCKLFEELDDDIPEHEAIRQQKLSEYRKTKLLPTQILTKSGTIFDKSYQGLLPEVLTYYFKKRKESKRIRKQIDAECEYLKKILKERETEANQ